MFFCFRNDFGELVGFDIDIVKEGNSNSCLEYIYRFHFNKDFKHCIIDLYVKTMLVQILLIHGRQTADTEQDLMCLVEALMYLMEVLMHLVEAVMF